MIAIVVKKMVISVIFHWEINLKLELFFDVTTKVIIV